MIYMPKPFVIGVAGGSASGKSTFCDALEKSLADFSVKTFHMDHYFKPKELLPTARAPITGVTYVDHNHPETADLPRLRLDLANAVANNVCGVIIVEGLLTLWDDEIRAMLDLKLFIDCRADERIVRRLRRNLQWGLSFDEIANVYLDLVRYRHDEYVEPSKWRADLILNGSETPEKGMEVIMSYVSDMIGQKVRAEKNMAAFENARRAFEGVADELGLKTEEDVVELCKQVRRERRLRHDGGGET